MLLDKPYFNILLETVNCRGGIDLNRQRISMEYGLPATVEFPVNPFIREGENELWLALYAGKDKKYFKNAKCKITLRVRPSGSDPHVNYTIASLSFRGDMEAIGTGIEGNDPEDVLNSRKDFKSDRRDGDIIIGEAKKLKPDHNGVIVSRMVTLPKIGLPKWAFFNSDPITGLSGSNIWGRIDEDTETNLRNELLPIYHAIWNALAQKNIQPILPLFEERGRELDAAFYRPPGTHMREMQEAFEDALKDPDRRLWPIKEEDIAVHVYDNNILVRLEQSRNPVISFEYLSGGAEHYDMVLRKSGDRWIVTR